MANMVPGFAACVQTSHRRRRSRCLLRSMTWRASVGRPSGGVVERSGFGQGHVVIEDAEGLRSRAREPYRTKVSKK